MRLLDDLIMFVFPGDVIDRCLLEIRPQEMFPEHLECPDCRGEDINRGWAWIAQSPDWQETLSSSLFAVQQS